MAKKGPKAPLSQHRVRVGPVTHFVLEPRSFSCVGVRLQVVQGTTELHCQN